MKSGNTVMNALLVPSELNDNGIEIKLETEYPFNNKFSYFIKTDKDFVFKIRIPSFAENILVNGNTAENTGELSFNVNKGEEISLDISYDTVPYFINRPYDLKTVRCGSFVFSLPIKFEKKMYEYVENKVERKFPYCDYEYIPKSEWSYGFSDGMLKQSYHGISEIPFSSEKPPITVSAKMAKIDWGLEDGFDTVCSKTPRNTEALDKEEEIQLYPYGCAKLRMTEMPFVKK
jgi:hypothetical protein